MDPTSSNTSVVADQRKVLVLHGFTQNHTVIHKKLVSFLPKDLTYVVPDGPIALDAEGHLAWLQLTTADLWNDNVIVSQADLDLLFASAERFAGAYDTVIGYSQGCLVAQLLLERGLIQANKLILINPIPAPKNNPPILSGTHSSIKTRVYVGDGDIWVQNQHTSFIEYQTDIHSDDLSRLEVIQHPKGHNIPVSKVYRDQYKSFLLE